MGYKFIRAGKLNVDSDIMSDNPNKKIRLDFHFNNNGNDDLWGQDDDITAEEFDLLEIQATQSCTQQVHLPRSNQVVNTVASKRTISETSEDLKQLQYELEGRVKLLSQTLEKSTKELNQERLNREQIINRKMKEFYEREANLQKEVEKMQSVLEFKEQEMKSIYSKLNVMKSQMQEKKDAIIEPQPAVNRKFQDFLKSSKSAPEKNSTESVFPSKFRRKHKLIVDTPKGKITGNEVVSSILCSRFAVPFLPSCESSTADTSSENFSFSPVAVVQLKKDGKSDELLKYYSCFLKQHVDLLRTLSCSNKAANSKKKSPISTKCREAGYSQTVLFNLRDIVYMCSHPTFTAVLNKRCGEHKNDCENKNCNAAGTAPSTSEQSSNENCQTDSIGCLKMLLESLSVLSNPNMYPNGYSKSEEIELSLSALLNICLSCPALYLDLMEELPIHILQSPHQSIPGLCTTLKLLTSLSGCEKFIPHLAHKNSNCLLCLIAAFLLNVIPYYPEKFAVPVELVEDFLSSVFSSENFVESSLKTAECIFEVIPGLIKSLWKYYQLKEEISSSSRIIKNGILMLHFMSCCVSNFKERRNLVEDEYISLISGILALLKENCEFKEFYDLIHSLWDFQNDMSEFDLDELCEETQASSNKSDVEVSY